MATTLDLRPQVINIKFEKGGTLRPFFYYLSPIYEAINISTYTARMQVRLTYDTATPIWDVDTTDGGLIIATGTAILDDGTLVPNAWGVKVNISDTLTAAVDWTTAVYDIELIEPGPGAVITMVKGTMTPYNEVTR